MSDDNPDINITVKDQVFTAKKNVLCEKSDYFQAMFRGNFAERSQTDLTIDVEAVDTESMMTIIQYLEGELDNLSDYEQQDIIKLAEATNYLQMNDLGKMIETTLEFRVSPSNCLELLDAAENLAYKRLAQSALSCALCSFSTVNVESISTIHKLARYLSHTNLESSMELDVFKFGLRWIQGEEMDDDALMIVLGCLDWKRVSLNTEISQMINLIKTDFPDGMALKVLTIISDLHKYVGSLGSKLTSESILYIQKMMTPIKIPEAEFSETLSLVEDSKVRQPRCYIPIVAMEKITDKPEFVSASVYTFTKEDGFKKWMDISSKNLSGWSLAQWGSHKLVVIGGTYTEVVDKENHTNYMTDMNIYNTYSKEWTTHEDVLTPIKNGIIAMVENELYIIGGVLIDKKKVLMKVFAPRGRRRPWTLRRCQETQPRLTLEQILRNRMVKLGMVERSAFVYDMTTNTYKEIMPLPDVCSAACAHQGEVYAAGSDQIYKYCKQLGAWEKVSTSRYGVVCMTSYKDHIYCSQRVPRSIYRFEPGTHTTLQYVHTKLDHPPATMCSLPDRLIAFTRPLIGPKKDYTITVEEFTDTTGTQWQTDLVKIQDNFDCTINDSPGSCALFLEPPSMSNNMSSFHKRYLSKYDNV